MKKLTRFIIDNGRFVRFYDDAKYLMAAVHRCPTVVERDWLLSNAELDPGTLTFVEDQEKLYVLKSTGWKLII